MAARSAKQLAWHGDMRMASELTMLGEAAKAGPVRVGAGEGSCRSGGHRRAVSSAVGALRAERLAGASGWDERSSLEIALDRLIDDAASGGGVRAHRDPRS